MSSVVQRIPAAASQQALAHFQTRLAYETDCADVFYAMNHETKDFVLLDVRTPTLYAAGHVPGALNLPTRTLSEQRLAEYRPIRCLSSTALVRIATAQTRRQ